MESGSTTPSNGDATEHRPLPREAYALVAFLRATFFPGVEVGLPTDRADSGMLAAVELALALAAPVSVETVLAGAESGKARLRKSAGNAVMGNFKTLRKNAAEPSRIETDFLSLLPSVFRMLAATTHWPICGATVS